MRSGGRSTLRRYGSTRAARIRGANALAVHWRGRVDPQWVSRPSMHSLRMEWIG